jgi:hypothetical protein
VRLSIKLAFVYTKVAQLIWIVKADPANTTAETFSQLHRFNTIGFAIGGAGSLICRLVKGQTR